MGAEIVHYASLAPRPLADISVSYPLHLVGMLGVDNLLEPHSVAYRERLRARPAYQRAIAIS